MIAVFPGSFDPITVGHESIIRRALPLFSKIIIAIGINSTKNTCFSLEERKSFIGEVFKGEPKIVVDSFSSFTVEFCKNNNASYIIRGLRTSTDFEQEKMLALTNKVLNTDIETMFFLTDERHTYINSSIIREILRYNGDISKFVPQKICKLVSDTYVAGGSSHTPTLIK